VTRDAFDIVGATDFDIRTYLARQSFVGLADGPLEAEESWFPEGSGWKRKIAVLDLNKQGLAKLFADRADWLIVDFIDERFDLLDVAGTRVSDIKEIRSPAFLEHYGAHMAPQRRLSAQTLEDWERGLEQFAEEVRSGYGAHRIVLHKARWARQMRGEDGSIVEFPDDVRVRIVQFNNLLDRYFEMFVNALPEAKVVEVDPAQVFADPDHRWSREPFHYTRDYYQAIVDQIRALKR
jgi:hypothetical protein